MINNIITEGVFWLVIKVDDTLKSNNSYAWATFAEQAGSIMRREGFAEYCLIIRPWLSDNEKKQYYNIYEGKGEGLWYIWIDPVNKSIKIAVDPIDCDEIFDDNSVSFIEDIIIDSLRCAIRDSTK